MTQVAKSPTIQDVARQAGVSAATVSRVLSAPERVSENTRERVQTAVRETGYTINQAARTLRQQKARTLLAAMPGIGNMFYAGILESVVHTAALKGYGVLVTSRLIDDPTRWLADYLQSNRADGLLLFDWTLDTQELHRMANNSGRLPLVTAYDALPHPRINAVITDNLLAAKRAVDHLVELGHRRIGHISGPASSALPNERLLGFREAMRDHRLNLREDWIIAGDYHLQSGIRAAEILLSGKDLPSALFIANDSMAIGAISAFRRAGIECPRDISVIGFDDVEFSGTYFPALTTMRQPRAEIGRLATETLIDQLEGPNDSDEAVRIVLRSELVVRDSTRAIEPG
jgi:LacI family repressor for deo operon, udp, cdd, tsx, nupC, and nupG